MRKSRYGRGKRRRSTSRTSNRRKAYRQRKIKGGHY